MCAFGWIGMNRYRASRATTVPRGSLEAPGPVDVAALPAAFAELQSGVPGELDPPAA